MKTRWIRAFATATAFGLVAGAIALGSTGSARPAGRSERSPPERHGCDDGSRPLAGPPRPPVVGDPVDPHRTDARPSGPLGSVDHVPWVKRELSLGSEEAGESKVLVSGGVVGQADGALQSDRAGTGPIPAPDLKFEGLQRPAQQPWL